MTRTLAILLLCIGLPALAAGEELPTWKQFPSKNKPRKHVMVQFTDISMHPTIAQVVEGGTVSWVNYGGMYQGSIVFSNEVAAAFTCSSLLPNWGKTGSGYHSIPITTGESMDDLEIPCPLKPGEYEYEIWLFTPDVEDPASMETPEARMQGKIIVQ